MVTSMLKKIILNHPGTARRNTHKFPIGIEFDQSILVERSEHLATEDAAI
jgi:hypothetical protein